jgi:hypothetical protein
LSIAAASTSQMRTSVIPITARIARAWNSDWLPVPMSASTLESRRARRLAAIADVAAVRSAVRRFISAIITG